MGKTLPKSSKEYSNRESLSWFSALKNSWRAALRIDRSQIMAIQAIRATIGFVLPLAIGVFTGHVIEGVSMAGGAAMLGSVGLNYTYRARARTMFFACFGIALSAFVGSITSRIDWLAILVVGIWGIAAGLLVAISQPAMIIGLQSTVALIVLSHFALDPLHAALQAGLMLAGALVQVVLAIIPLPWQHTTPELAALAAVYQKLANYADDPSNEQSGQQVRNALLKAHSTLLDSNLQSQQGKIFYGLLEEAEHIRLSLIVLTNLRQNLTEGEVGQSSSMVYLDQIAQSIANELRNIANELQPTRTSNNLINPQQQMKKLLAALRRQETQSHDEETLQQILAYYDALRNQLHKARKLAKAWRHPRQRLGIQVNVPRQRHLRVHDAQSILLANLTLRSTNFRHAIRLGFALALATALYRVLPLPIERGYWIPLTVLLVLKPEFTTTFTRGVARTLGTVLGAVLTTLLVSTLVPGKEILVVADAIVAYLAFSLLYANYAIFSAFITVETVILLTFVTPQPTITAAYRAIDTTIGGVLALLIYALWPTWERSQASNMLADRIESLRRYLVAVLRAYANPSAYDDFAIHSRLIDSRLARSNAEASVSRSLQEPETHRVDPDLAQGLLGAADNIARSTIALQAYMLNNPSRHALPEISTFSNKVDEALHILATIIREGQPDGALPNLQEALSMLEDAEKSDQYAQHEVNTDLRFVITEAKRIVRNIHTMNQLIAAKLEQRSQHRK